MPSIPDPEKITESVEARYYKGMVRKALARSHHIIEHGTPERQDKHIALWAGPFIREALNPRRKTKLQEEEELAELAEEFHHMRGQILSDVDVTVEEFEDFSDEDD